MSFLAGASTPAARLVNEEGTPRSSTNERSTTSGYISIAEAAEQSTTALGDWYATVLFWKPQVALFVSEATLLPVLMPFASAATVIDRFPAAVATVLEAHGLSRAFIEHEVANMSEHQLAKTTNRSVVGIMNEFAYLGDAYRFSNDVPDLVTLSVRLAETPCGPLYSRHGSPDRELAALAAQCGR
ncbi:MAG: DUF6933 domain-containing protein [Actinomycetota bacterium]